ncbi:putative prolyl 4-hydroxylase 9 [Glycine soja]|uniref:probable prolyl 4-hydroxylase 9 isoform X1 n=1 Tax=Glycine soja TaxID=3848 RepID=UPI00103B9DF8|nr:probable prolyl 4-hydroxylase 9 isoform X1 [Glycine soja]
MKTKTVKGNWRWNWRMNKLDLPSVFLICIFFFLAGFSASSLFSPSQEHEYDLRLIPRARLLEKSTHEKTEHHLLKAGDSGDDYITLIPFQVLSWYPRALYFPNFASAEQCETIIEMARGGLKPSTLVLRKGETEESTKGIRTSYGVFMSASEDETGILDSIEEKIAKATKIPRTHGEAFNILRYEVGQKYSPHYDAFDEAEFGPLQSQRAASFLLYLTDVPEGGETLFPYENGFNRDGSYDFEDCIGLRVRPRKGDGLLFYSLLPNGTIDQTSVHGSCPVIKGEKWVATKWIRDQVLDD